MYSTKLFKFPPRIFEHLRSWHQRHPWAWTDVLLPFLTTRFALLLIGWYATVIPPNNSYPIENAVKRGWQFTSYHLIDIWARWDSGWYLTIIKNGYQSNSDISSMMSNIAFYPLYPYLVKLILLPFPASFRSDTKIILIGILLSNAFLLASLFILYRLVFTLFNQTDTAKRTVLYLLIFPSSFFFSAFYTEATFLFFAVCAFYFATKRSWIMGNICGFFLALARPLGFLIFLPLAIQYLESLEWKIKQIRWEIFWFALAPAGLFTYLAYIYTLTGDLLAPLHAVQAWGRNYAPIWKAVLSPQPIFPRLTNVEQFIIIAWLLLAVYALFKLPSLSYGVYALLMIVPELIHGTLLSTIRYDLIVFPVFITLGLQGKNSTLHKIISVLFFTLMVIMMVLWSRFYWIA